MHLDGLMRLVAYKLKVVKHKAINVLLGRVDVQLLQQGAGEGGGGW